jgi:high-affinity iron transporter
VRGAIWRPVMAAALVALAWTCTGCGTTTTSKQVSVESTNAGPSATAADSNASRRLAAIAEDMQAWAQVPTGPIPNLSYARTTVAGLRREALTAPEVSTSTTQSRSLTQGLIYLQWLLALRPQGLVQRATLAQELAWSTTQLATLAARGDDPTGTVAEAAETIREALFRARWQLTIGRRSEAIAAVGQAQASFARVLAPRLGASTAVEQDLSMAATAAQQGDPQALAAARGRTVSALSVAAYELTLRAIAERQLALAREWAAVRDLGPSTGTSTVNDDAQQAVAQLAAGTLTPTEATMAVRRDELDAFQRRTVALVQQATLDGYLALDPARAEAGALAAGYWQVLAPIYAQHLDSGTAGVDAALATIASPPGAAAQGSHAGTSSTAGATPAAPVGASQPGASAQGSGSGASSTAGAAPAAIAGASTVGAAPVSSSPASAAIGSSPADVAARWKLQSANSTALSALGAFTAAPATTAEQGQRVRRLVEAMRFTIARLCGATPVPPNGEPQGTVAGPPVVARLVNDLRPTLDPADAGRLAQADSALATLPGAFGISGEESSPKTYHQSASVRSACSTATAGISTVFPTAWERHDDDADFEQIERALARAAQAAAQGNWTTASGAAREAYAVFDLTPELRLLAVDPALATRIEALFWNGGSTGRSLFDALANHASHLSLRRRQSELEGALDQAEIVLDVSHSTAAVAVNSGIVVFREGLEALLIVAALSAGFVTVGGRWRRPVIVGALLALPATLLTWALSNAILTSFVGYGLQLQAVLDVAALAVLTIMLAWFFQKFCWTRFTAREQARHRRMVERAPRSARVLGPSLGLGAVGFTVIYREGFETVLYLQALREQAGAGAVVEGVLLGGVFTATIALLMLRLRRRLPYRRVVVATATLVGILTVVMTGQAMRALQAVGWLAITPVHIDLPVWAGQWLGLYPSVQTLLAQLACAIAIPLAAVLSERLRTRRLERRMAVARERIARKRAASASSRGRADGGAQADEAIGVDASETDAAIGLDAARVDAAGQEAQRMDSQPRIPAG